VRTILTVYQAVKHEQINATPLYQYLYFEFPYHIFNIVAYIVFMQWLDLSL
jgi:hypothetical protein